MILFYYQTGRGLGILSILFLNYFSCSIPRGLPLHGSPQVDCCGYDALCGGLTKICEDIKLNSSYVTFVELLPCEM